MNLWSALLGAMGLLSSPPASPPPPEPAPSRRRLTSDVVGDAIGGPGTVPVSLYTTSTHVDLQRLFAPAIPMPGVVPPGVRPMAMDENGWAGQWGGFGNITEGMYWLGYPYLAELAQRPEYRRISETTAREMTRRWFKLQATGDDDKSDKITALNQAIDEHRLQAKFRKLAELDGFFGRSHLYIDTGHNDDRDQLKLPLVFDQRVIKRGDGLKGFHVIEPQWVYPALYNSIEPLRGDYYRPSTWFVMGKEVHATRVLTFIGREMPDMFKATYAFGGLSLSQMAKPYVDNWLRTRQAISDLVHSFSTPVLSTNMGAILNAGAAQEFRFRAQLFNGMRDNNNLMMLDKTTEDFRNVSTPLGGLDHLQAQAQEHMASVCGIPLVVLLGITPSGLNATSEGEIQVWAQFIHAAQTNFFDAHLKSVLSVLMLDLFGAVDPDITHEWEPLEELNEKERNEARKQQADTDVLYINAGVLSPDELRQKLANEADSPYHGLDLSEPAPGPPEQEEDPLGGPPDGSGGGPGGAGGGKPYEPGASPRVPHAPSLGGPQRDAAGDTPPAPAEGDRTRIVPGPDDKTDIHPGPQDDVRLHVGAKTDGMTRTHEHTIIKPGPHDVAHVFLGPNDRGHVKLGSDGGISEDQGFQERLNELLGGLADLQAYQNWWNSKGGDGNAAPPFASDADGSEPAQDRFARLMRDLTSDAHEFHEEDVVRGEGGKFAKKGEAAGPAATESPALPEGEKREAAIRSVPAPLPQSAKAGRTMQSMVTQALTQGVEPEKIAQALTLLAGNYTQSVPARYANLLMRHLEAHHGLADGALGKARVKGQGGPPPPPQPPPEPPESREQAERREAEAKARETQAKRLEHARATPEPSRKYIGAQGDRIRDKVRHAIETGADPYRLGADVTDFAGQYARHAYAQYANQLLRHIESVYGIEPNGLGRAIPKAGPPPKPPPAPPEPPKEKTEPPKPPEPSESKSYPQTFEDVLEARKGQWKPDEQKWHRAAWNSATPVTLGAMLKTKPLSHVQERRGTRANYWSVEHRIAMDPGDDHVVWRHEYGHAMDSEGDTRNYKSQVAEYDRRTDASELVNGVDADRQGKLKIDAKSFDETMKQHNLSPEDVEEFTGKGKMTRTAVLMKVLGGGKLGLPSQYRNGATPMEEMMFNDFLGALTHNRIGRGHTNAYYDKNPKHHCAEMFANYVALCNSKGGKVYRAVMHQAAPRACAHFDKIISDMADRKGEWKEVSLAQRRERYA